MPALPDDVSTLSSRYTRLAELCRESAAKARLPGVVKALSKMAESYDRRARQALAAGRSKVKPVKARPRTRIPKPPMQEAEAPAARPLFRFAELKRKAGLGAHTAEHGTD